MIDMDLSTVASAVSGWAVAFGGLVYAKWKSKTPKQKGEILDEVADALEDGRLDPKETVNLIESFWYTQEGNETE